MEPLLLASLGFFGRRPPAAPPPPPPPPPPPAFAEYAAAFAPYVIYFLVFWASVSLLTYLVPTILANMSGPKDLRKRYDARWALVTGASSGIGKALAEALAQQGLNVVLVALEDALLHDTFGELRERYPAVEFRSVGVDLTRADGAYIDSIDAATRDIHVPIHFLNAGFMVTGFFHDVPIAKHMANLQCNAVAGVRIAHHFLPKMYASKKPGLIVFTSSAAAIIPSPFTTLYSATKAFVSRFASSLAAEAGPQGIDVMAVHPSPVRSNFLKGTTNFDVINNFYKFSTGPEAVPPQILRKVGSMQVLADLGPVSVMMRLVTKLLDDNFFAACFAAAATLLPDYQRLAVKAGMSPRSLRKWR